MTIKFINLSEIDTNYISEARFDVGFTSSTYDDRGLCSKNIVNANCDILFEVQYDFETYSLKVNNDIIKLNELSSHFNNHNAQRIIFDSTNLSFAEIIILLNIYIKTFSVGFIEFIYVEPDEYSSRKPGPLSTHSFDLSDKIHDTAAIPPFYYEVGMDDRAHLMAFLGFESDRLARALNPDEGANHNTLSVAFGVPPFKTEWEVHSMMQNVQTLSQYSPQDCYFIPANNPRTAYHIIEHVNQSLDEDERLILAPLGTKPEAIGVALYTVLNERIGVLFDFPQKRQKRTKGIGPIHNYSVMIV